VFTENAYDTWGPVPIFLIDRLFVYFTLVLQSFALCELYTFRFGKDVKWSDRCLFWSTVTTFACRDVDKAWKHQNNQSPDRVPNSRLPWYGSAVLTTLPQQSLVFRCLKFFPAFIAPCTRFFCKYWLLYILHFLSMYVPLQIFADVLVGRDAVSVLLECL
jgi:hypothetical protein